MVPSANRIQPPHTTQNPSVFLHLDVEEEALRHVGQDGADQRAEGEHEQDRDAVDDAHCAGGKVIRPSASSSMPPARIASPGMKKNRHGTAYEQAEDRRGDDLLAGGLNGDAEPRGEQPEAEDRQPRRPPRRPAREPLESLERLARGHAARVDLLQQRPQVGDLVERRDYRRTGERERPVAVREHGGVGQERDLDFGAVGRGDALDDLLGAERPLVTPGEQERDETLQQRGRVGCLRLRRDRGHPPTRDRGRRSGLRGGGAGDRRPRSRCGRRA